MFPLFYSSGFSSTASRSFEAESSTSPCDPSRRRSVMESRTAPLLPVDLTQTAFNATSSGISPPPSGQPNPSAVPPSPFPKTRHPCHPDPEKISLSRWVSLLPQNPERRDFFTLFDLDAPKRHQSFIFRLVMARPPLPPFRLRGLRSYAIPFAASLPKSNGDYCIEFSASPSPPFLRGSKKGARRLHPGTPSSRALTVSLFAPRRPKKRPAIEPSSPPSQYPPCRPSHELPPGPARDCDRVVCFKARI